VFRSETESKGTRRSQFSVHRRASRFVSFAASLAFSAYESRAHVSLSISELREKLCSAAVRLCELINYRSAGTVEFLVDDNTADYYFLELNARLQVEHPVTEAIRPGLDLPDLMLRLAMSQTSAEPFSLPSQESLSKTTGHAIEARESNDFLYGSRICGISLCTSLTRLDLSFCRCLRRNPSPQLQACAWTTPGGILPGLQLAPSRYLGVVGLSHLVFLRSDDCESHRIRIDSGRSSNETRSSTIKNQAARYSYQR